jgi:hypothetical protein
MGDHSFLVGRERHPLCRGGTFIKDGDVRV